VVFLEKQASEVPRGIGWLKADPDKGTQGYVARGEFFQILGWHGLPYRQQIWSG
jgi:hypothetical protein